MVIRKMGEYGRITIPKEFLDKYNIKKDDPLEIFDGEGFIAIKKHQLEYVCAITGKITSKGHQFGNCFISFEGLDLIKKYLMENNSPKNKGDN